MNELKQMVSDLAFQVKGDYSKGKIIIEESDHKPPQKKKEFSFEFIATRFFVLFGPC